MKIFLNNRILYFSFILFLTIGLNRSVIGPLIPIISKDLDTGLDLIGLAISLNAIGLLITGFTTSSLIMLMNIKRTIFLGLIFSILSCIGIYFSYSYTIFLISNITIGIGIGILSVSTMSLIASNYPTGKTRSLLKATIGFTVGVMIAPFLVSGILFLNIDWRNIFLYILIPQVFLIAYLVFLKTPLSNGSNRKSFKSSISINKNILKNPYFIICCVIVFIHGAVMYTFSTWFTSYFSTLNITVNISSLFLASYSAAVLIGMIIKNILIKTFKEKKVLLFAIIFSFIFLLLIFLINNITIKNIFIFLFGLSIAGVFTISFSLSTAVAPKNTDSISGFIHSSQYIAIVIFQYLSGFFSEHYSKNSVLYIDILLLFILVIVIILFLKIKYFRDYLKGN